MKLSRRQFLMLTGLGFASAAGSQLLPRSLTKTQGSTTSSTKGIAEGGLSKVSLQAREEMVQVAGQPARLWTYNGLFPGPTLRLREGERVQLDFSNTLPEATNLHLHGLHVPPNVDDTFLEIPPGERATYAFDVPHGSAGTYWYHPHLHGRVAPQLFAGLAGTIIVEGPADELFAEADEHLLVFKDVALTSGRVVPHTHDDWMNGKEGDLVLVNGTLRPTLRPEKGLLRLRLLNASNARYYRLALEDHPLYLVATDGGLIERPLELEELLLAPGERAEVLVRLERAGNFALHNRPYERGVMTMAADTEAVGGHDRGSMAGMDHEAKPEVLLTLSAPSNLQAAALPGTLVSVPVLQKQDMRPTHRIVFSENHMAARFFVDGREFDPRRVDVTAKQGDLEIWEVVNEGDMDHPFHLHIYPFQVLSRNGVAEPYRAWRDVINLPAGETVRLAVPLSDFSGKTVFHCHIVEHEDRGMMGVLEVRPS